MTQTRLGIVMDAIDSIKPWKDSSFAMLLEAQRRAVNARTDMISLRNQRLQNRVDLHLALGGDFR